MSTTFHLRCDTCGKAAYVGTPEGSRCVYHLTCDGHYSRFPVVPARLCAVSGGMCRQHQCQGSECALNHAKPNRPALEVVPPPDNVVALTPKAAPEKLLDTQRLRELLLDIEAGLVKGYVLAQMGADGRIRTTIDGDRYESVLLASVLQHRACSEVVATRKPEDGA